MSMGYISETTRNRTHNLFRPKREAIPLVPQWGLYRLLQNCKHDTDLCLRMQSNFQQYFLKQCITCVTPSNADCTLNLVYCVYVLNEAMTLACNFRRHLTHVAVLLTCQGCIECQIPCPSFLRKQKLKPVCSLYTSMYITPTAEVESNHISCRLRYPLSSIMSALMKISPVTASGLIHSNLWCAAEFWECCQMHIRIEELASGATSVSNVEHQFPNTYALDLNEYWKTQTGHGKVQLTIDGGLAIDFPQTDLETAILELHCTDCFPTFYNSSDFC